jgi:hypothetical protein
MKIQIIKNQVRELYIGHLRDISLNSNDWLSSGQSAYSLYAYLSTFFHRSTILNIGTNNGGSALSLSYNPTNKVISYDLIEHTASSIKKENITWKIQDFMQDETLNWNNIPIIMIDINSHDGSQERIIMNWLREKGWKGILIHTNIGSGSPCIQLMWDEITEEKFDVTEIAHISGTGIVNFGNIHEISIV